CIGAAGSIETIAAILQLKNEFIHGNLNSENLNTDIQNIIDRNCVPEKTLEKTINNFIKASFGFGDVNACIFVSKI
ncbi:MAG: beta-ketoacyl-[acyl-carrier-protein] synthase family protein, partial [Bacteroidales bacterium]|nr:beta-ketoacyl-[acyl-carrier-protein] synthase family protein [Bacteroidales bacterium]